MTAQERKDMVVKAMRKAGYATVADLASAMGMSESAVRRWVDGKGTPVNRGHAMLMADLLFLDFDVLFPDWRPLAARYRPDVELTAFQRVLANAGYGTVLGFAEALGVTLGTARAWINGAVPKDDEYVYRAAGLLNVAPTDLWPHWVPETNVFRRYMKQAGLRPMDLADKLGVSQATVDAWIHSGKMPWSDRVVLRCAELLEADPNELWPEWEPRPERMAKINKRKLEENRTSTPDMPRLLHGLELADLGGDGMAVMRHKANVHVGQRFMMTYTTKEGAVRRPGTVVECADNWFRVKYDTGWSECFHYQCRVGSERSHFRSTEGKRNTKEA